MGESFFSLSLFAAKKQLRIDLKKYEKEIEELEAKADDCQKGMKDLKVML
jgi:prefoldin subunit 4